MGDDDTGTRIRNGLERQLRDRQTLIAAGGRPIGWKVGFGAPAALAQFGLDGPLTGFLMAAGRLEPGAQASLAGWAKPVAEPEVAIHIGHDLPGGSDRAAAAAAVTGLGPAIELADLHTPPVDIEEILACNIYHRHVLFGPCDTGRAGAVLDGLSGHVMRNGADFADMDDLEANTGELIGIVQRVANTLADAGETLRAGEVIIAGSVTPPIFLEADDTEIAFGLDPVGEVSVRLTSG